MKRMLLIIQEYFVTHSTALSNRIPELINGCTIFHIRAEAS